MDNGIQTISQFNTHTYKHTHITMTSVTEDFNAQAIQDAKVIVDFYLDVIDKESIILAGLRNLICTATDYSLAETDMCFIENDITIIGATSMSDIIDTRCKNVDDRILELTTDRDNCVSRIRVATDMVAKFETKPKLTNKRIKVEKIVCNTRPILLRGCKIQKT